MASSNSVFSIDKLSGRDNYPTWKFAMQALLEHEDLWNCVTGSDKDEKRNTKARSKIILSVDPVNYVHIKSANTAKEVWENLSKAFVDSGLTRKVGLLKTLVTTKLENCKSVDEYVNQIVMTAHKLNGLDFNVSEEWIGALLLAGLPDNYGPMIMGLESSGVEITGDSVKTKLLQDVKLPVNNPRDKALYVKNNSNSNFRHESKPIRCYKCNKYGHFGRDCRNSRINNERNSERNYQKRENNPPKRENKGENKCFYAMSCTENRNTAEWLLDSCASSHITNDEKLLENVKLCGTIEVTTANKEKMVVERIGDAKIKSTVNNETIDIEVKNVLYLPNAAANLLSVGKIVEKGHKVVFEGSSCEIKTQDGNVLASAVLENGVYKMLTLPPEKTFMLNSKQEKGRIWHRRLGHLNRFDMIKLKGMSEGYDLEETCNQNCESCIKGKQVKKSFKKSLSRATGLLNLIHSDLCGPMENESFGGARYMLTFLDDHSRKAFVYFLKEKSEVPETFVKFKKFVENQTERKIKVLRTDNGGEYVNNRLKNILEDAGIKHQLTVAYNPQQNGRAERLNRTLIEKARCMLSDTKLGKRFWAEAVNTACYIINRSPSSAVQKTPYEIWNKKPPNLEHLRVFGSKAMAHIPKEKRKKLDEKSKKYVFVGYSEEVKGYRLADEDGNILLSRDVIFFENELLKEKIESEEKQPTKVVEMSDELKEDNELTEEVGDPQNEVEEIVLRRSSRIPKPVNMEDFVVYSACEDPETIEEAMNSEEKDDWMKAIASEYESLKKNNTWTLVDKPEDRKLLDTKWVFKKKYGTDGNINRFKARLVVKGCSQVAGRDYKETYAPVIRYTSLRYIFALAARYDMEIHHLDVTTAYLQGDLDDEIYIKQPKMFNSGAESNKVLKLKKAVYGLKQSGRVWNIKLTKTLKNLNFEQSKADQCVFYKCENDDRLIITVYVDDILVISNNIEKLNETKNQLKENFQMKDLGEVKNILGIEVNRNKKKST